MWVSIVKLESMYETSLSEVSSIKSSYFLVKNRHSSVWPDVTKDLVCLHFCDMVCLLLINKITLLDLSFGSNFIAVDKHSFFLFTKGAFEPHGV